MRPKCVVTGATGLLGQELVPVLEKSFDVQPWSHQKGPDGVRKVDLREPEQVKSALSEDQPDLVVHMAAYREPDFCEEKPFECRRLNVEPCRMFADWLPDAARLVFISTDYVFDGTNPPYREDAERCPVNVYGQSKVEAEDIVLQRSGSVVLRVPLLIGRGPTLEESGFIAQMREAVLSRQSQEVDDVLARFPTWTRDVGEAVRWLLEREEEGTWHFSGLEGKTRYGWTLEMARILDAEASHLIPSEKVIPRTATRPDDSQLVPARFQEAGYEGFSSFEKAVRAVLEGS